jgi:spore coat polysaccharide biosynthesis predicted glycosyltransferase SpsG
MESEVRRLLIEHGVKNVKECVEKVCRSLYEELREVYGEAVVAVGTPEPAPVVEAPPVEKERRLRIVKKKEPVETPVEAAAEAAEAPGDKVVEVVTLRVKKKVAAPVEVQQAAEESDSDSDATVPVDVPTTYRVKTPEEIKKERYEYRSAVEQKRAQLIEKGIKPESLLTRENLEKWLGAGLSYQRIAREQTGCHESVISATARMFGLKSKIGKIVMLRNMQQRV